MNDMTVIEREGLVVILRGVPAGKIENTVNALYDGGVRIVEVAFDPGDKDTAKKTAAVIKDLVRVWGERLFVGAGTVICGDYARAAHEAGARFIFSPDADPEVIRLTKKLGMLSVPGALTPTEMKSAHQNGADLVKLFPATIDKLDYIINITRPLSHIPFICVGGTNENTIEAFFRAGARGVGTGLSILKPGLIEKGDYREITRLARLHTDKIKQIRSG